MKSTYKILVLLLVFMSWGSLFAEGQRDSPKSQEFNVSDFHSIKNSISADLEIYLGEQQRIEAFGKRSAIKRLKIYVQNGELIIRRKWSLLPMPLRDIKIRIAMEGYDILSLGLSSSGNAEIIGQIKAEKTEFKTSSSGSITAGGDVEYLSASISSSGNIDFTGVNRELDLRISSSGDMRISTQAIKIKAVSSSSGNLMIEGAAIEAEIKLSSNGDFLGKDFIVEEADVILSSSGNAELSILKELNAKLSSSGNLLYRGSPHLGSISTTSSGKILNQN
ncbi:MAG: DUF2807 domain-containing protein [Spirochaetaceae bacterium]|nr:DUF2807 domain-containing protein [Spirochaetaceae bacterium]